MLSGTSGLQSHSLLMVSNIGMFNKPLDPLSTPTDTSINDCLCPSLDLAVALAKFFLVLALSCEDTLIQALVLS